MANLRLVDNGLRKEGFLRQMCGRENLRFAAGYAKLRLTAVLRTVEGRVS
jgi:hypothetical protein